MQGQMDHRIKGGVSQLPQVLIIQSNPAMRKIIRFIVNLIGILLAASVAVLTIWVLAWVAYANGAIM